ncbi:MAG: helix-turn-helix domain-containing protein [Halohasta sp.]
MPGIRAKISVADPEGCPLAASTENDVSVSDVTWTRASDGMVTESFTTTGSTTGTGPDSIGAEATFEVGDQTTYRFEREADSCVCERVEAAGHPIDNVEVRNGQLTVTVHLPAASALREVVDALSASGAHVSVDYLVRDATAEDRRDLTIVDRGRLTARQQDVLETAYQMGYFSYPREHSAAEVAEALGIARSTFAEHLAAAQRELLASIVNG